MAMKVRYTVLDGEVLSENRGGVERDYVPDPLGSTIALLDNTQTQTDTFGYWPYGEVAARTGTNATALQFLGTLGYYNGYVRKRYLDSVKGRWKTEDPIGFDGGDFNPYRYVGNNPLSYTDFAGTLTQKGKGLKMRNRIQNDHRFASKTNSESHLI